MRTLLSRTLGWVPLLLANPSIPLWSVNWYLTCLGKEKLFRIEANHHKSSCMTSTSNLPQRYCIVECVAHLKRGSVISDLYPFRRLIFSERERFKTMERNSFPVNSANLLCTSALVFEHPRKFIKWNNYERSIGWAISNTRWSLTEWSNSNSKHFRSFDVFW